VIEITFHQGHQEDCETQLSSGDVHEQDSKPAPRNAVMNP
jgi:hypothetical protein